MEILDNLKKTSSLLMNSNTLKYQELDINKIKQDVNQPRKEFDQKDIEILAQSIKEVGLLQPITVRHSDSEEDDKYIICFGERRWRAACEANLTKVPVIIIDSDKDLLEKQLVENIQRTNLTHEEISETIKVLVNDKKMKKKDVAQKIGRSSAYVTNYCTFSKIPFPRRNLLQKLTNDMTLIIEINKILEEIDKKNGGCNNEISKKVEDFLEEKESINRNTPKEIRELFLESKKEEVDLNENIQNEEIIHENQEDIYNTQEYEEQEEEQEEIENIYNNNESNQTTYEDYDEFDDDEYCNDYEIKDKPVKKSAKKDKQENIKINDINYDYENYAFMDSNLNKLVILDEQFAKKLSSEQIDKFKKFIENL